jgi:putative oxidoreductase
MNLGLLILRLAVGGFFVGHGAQKLFGAFGGHGLSGTGQFFESIGMKPGHVHARAAGTAEFAGGLLLIFGLFTPFAAAAITAVMIVAILTVHGKNGPWSTDGGYEYNVVLAAAVFCLAGVGAGTISLDNAFGLNLSGTGWALGELAAGILGAVGAVLVGRREDAQRSATTPRTATRPTPTDRFARTEDATQRPTPHTAEAPLEREPVDRLPSS